MTAYSRIVPAYFLDPYYLVILRKTRDLPLLRKRASIFCLEEEVHSPIGESGYNSARLLAHPLVKAFLKRLPPPRHLLLYQGYPELEDPAKREGWDLLANPASLRIRVAQRAFFERMAADLGLRKIPGSIHPLEAIHAYSYDYWATRVGLKFVVQLPDLLQGGGRGTFFVGSNPDYEALRARLKGNIWRGIPLKSVSVRRFVEGTPVSMALCITRHGILFSRLQRQLIDLPYCRDFPENGVFCGHSWSLNAWPGVGQEDALKQARRIGEYLARIGYKGILGIDFVMDEHRGEVFPVEVNPRFTGAFPMLSLLQMKEGLIPLEVFHILEFLNASYEIDLDGLNEAYAHPLKGSHILLFLLPGRRKRTGGELEAGLYEWSPKHETAFFVKSAFEYQAIRNEHQFLVVDGPPETGGKPFPSGDPFYRLARLLFPSGVVDGAGILSPRAFRTAEWAHACMTGRRV